MAYTHWFACVPLGIADDNEYWRDAGLKVQLRGYQTSQEVVEALNSGEVDLGYDMLATWLDVGLRGVPIRIVAETDWSNGGDKLLVRNGVSLASEKGSPIAVYMRSSALMLFLREGLARDHLALPDYPIVEVPEQEQGLKLFKDGKIDLVVTNEPWASRIERAGARTLATTADFPGVSPEGFAVRSGRIDDATLERFFKAWFRAVAFLHDPAKSADVARIASIYAFAGSESITKGDVSNYAGITPVHDPATALRENDLERGNLGELVRRMVVLRRLEGLPVPRAKLAELFHLGPIRNVAAAGNAGTVAASEP